MQASSRSSPDSRLAGGVEIREDVPLKVGAGGWSRSARCCAGGPRLILAAFAVLSAAITLALLTQIYYGDYEVVPHGSVASSAAACSRAGADALKAGGRALDAAAAAALCLAVLAPHRTSLDASGSMLYWDYREGRSKPPTLYEWGTTGNATIAVESPPQLVAALATLHASLGVLPWARVLQPAIEAARYGFPVSDGLALMGRGVAGSNITSPELATFLQSLLANSSADIAASWGGATLVRSSSAAELRAGEWRLFSGSAVAGRALSSALSAAADGAESAQVRVVNELKVAATSGWVPSGVATALAAVDSKDTYAALTTGLSVPFGSGPPARGGWVRDVPATRPDLAPAIMLDDTVCGSRYVIGAESSAALAQGAAALAAGGAAGAAGAVEQARVAVLPGGQLALEDSPAPSALPAALQQAAAAPAPAPYAAVNLVLQRADALTSHADSRGGGLAFRF